MSKQLMVDVDRISNLPDPVLCHILSFLSTKEAVSTSILSTRWRYLFLSVSNLDLDDDFFFCLPNSTRHTAITEFVNFGDRMLFSQTTNLDKLFLSIAQDTSHRLNMTQDTSRLCSWISVAVTLRRVQQLHLCVFDFFNSFKLPDVLFTCKTLAILKLQILTALYVPDEVCLPNLKTLHLLDFEFVEADSIQRLISSCPILDDLLIDCDVSSVSRFSICHPFLKRLVMLFGDWDILSDTLIVIDAPSLVYLEYYGHIEAGYSVLNLNSLVKATIRFLPVPCAYGDDIGVFEYLSACDFIRGIANVKSLISGNSVTTHLLCREPLPLFDKLVELEVMHKEKGILDLLHRMPILEKLSFHGKGFGKLATTCLTNYVPSCVLNHLKTIEISLIGQPVSLENFKYFLKHASVLETMTIHANQLDENEKLKIAEELLASPRKSKKCSIMVVV